MSSVSRSKYFGRYGAASRRGVRIRTRSSFETALGVDVMGLRSIRVMVDELMTKGS